MTPFLKKSSKCWFVTVTTREKQYVRLSSGTRDQDVATSMRIKDGSLAQSTVDHYRRQARVAFPIDELTEQRLPVLKSSLTPAFFKAKLAGLAGSGTSKRRHAAAWASCLAFLVDGDHLERSPLADVKIPRNNKTKPPFIERLDDVVRFVNHMEAGPHRAAAALREGAGVELQAMLATRKRDIVDVGHRVIWAHGEKNEARDRQVIVDEWAWTILMAYVKANPMTEDALLFAGVTERSHRAEVYRVRNELREQGVNIPANYKPHNCRNTFAVRGMKEGRDPVLLSNNLGHGDTSELLRRYGKYRPAITDLVRADQRGKKEG
jgi:site-specific recombinase XerC